MPPTQNQVPNQSMPAASQVQPMAKKAGIPTWIKVIIVIVIIIGLGILSTVLTGIYLFKKVVQSGPVSELIDAQKNQLLKVGANSSTSGRVDKDAAAEAEMKALFSSGKSAEEIARGIVTLFKKNYPVETSQLTDDQLYQQALQMVTLQKAFEAAAKAQTR